MAEKLCLLFFKVVVNGGAGKAAQQFFGVEIPFPGRPFTEVEGVDAKDRIACQTETFRQGDIVIIFFLKGLDVFALCPHQTVFPEIHGAAPFVLKQDPRQGAGSIFWQQQITFDAEPGSGVEFDGFLCVFSEVHRFQHLSVLIALGGRIVQIGVQTFLNGTLPPGEIVPFFSCQIAGAHLAELSKTVFHKFFILEIKWLDCCFNIIFTWLFVNSFR